MGEHDHGAGGDDAHHRGDAHGLHGELGMAALQHVPAGHGHGHERAHDEQRVYRMGVTGEDGRIEGSREEVGNDRLGTLGVQLAAGGRLHPRVRDEDPQSRQARSGPDEPGGHHVELRRDALAPEQQHAEEDRLQEEGEQRLGGQRRPEDIAYEPRVVRPVRAEGELHGNARGHSDGEGRGEHFHPELRRRSVLGFAGAIVARLVDGQNEPESDGQGHEQEVVGHRQRELNTRQQRHISESLHGTPPFAIGPAHPSFAAGRQ